MPSFRNAEQEELKRSKAEAGFRQLQHSETSRISQATLLRHVTITAGQTGGGAAETAERAALRAILAVASCGIPPVKSESRLASLGLKTGSD